MNVDGTTLSTSSRSSDTEDKRIQDTMSKLCAESKIKSGEFIVVEKKGKSVSSSAWTKFGEVRDKHTLKYTGFVQCFSCKTIKIFKKTAGPSVLARHVCFQSRSSANKVIVTPDMKETFREACIDVIAADVRPFNMFSGPRFTNLIQKAVDFGAKYGSVDAAELLSDPTTISRACKARAIVIREKIMPEVLEMAEEGFLAATTDLWTGNYNKKHFLTLTVHYINKNWELISRVLFTTKFPEESETAQNIHTVLVDKLHELGICPAVAKNIVFVTDNGANIKRALEISSIRRLYCAAHCLNIILKHTFTLKLVNLDIHSEEGTEVLDTVSLVVASVKILDKTLGKKLKDPHSNTPGRYTSAVPMLEAVDVNFDQICEVLDAQGYQALKERLDLEKLREMVAFMKPIEVAAKPFGNTLDNVSLSWLQNHINYSEDDSQLVKSLKTKAQKELAAMTTLKLILKCKEIVTLFKHYGVMETLDTSLKQATETRWNSKLIMLQSFLRNFEKVNSILKEHNREDLTLSSVEESQIASLIDFLLVFKEETEKLEGEKSPTLQYYLLSYCRLRKHCLPNGLDDDGMRNLRQRAYNLLEQKFVPDKTHKIATFLWPQFRKLKMLSADEKEEVLNEVRAMCEKVDSENPLLSSPPKKVKDDYDDWRDDDYGKDEIQTYIRGVPGDSSDLCSWWRQQERRFPKLRRVAQIILGIPATSAPSERVFSTAGCVISARRSNISPENVDSILFLHSYLHGKTEQSHT